MRTNQWRRCWLGAFTALGMSLLLLGCTTAGYRSVTVSGSARSGQQQITRLRLAGNGKAVMESFLKAGFRLKIPFEYLRCHYQAKHGADEITTLLYLNALAKLFAHMGRSIRTLIAGAIPHSIRDEPWTNRSGYGCKGKFPCAVFSQWFRSRLLKRAPGWNERMSQALGAPDWTHGKASVKALNDARLVSFAKKGKRLIDEVVATLTITDAADLVVSTPGASSSGDKAVGRMLWSLFKADDCPAASPSLEGKLLGRRVSVRFRKGWMIMRLPVGRASTYPSALKNVLALRDDFACRLGSHLELVQKLGIGYTIKQRDIGALWRIGNKVVVLVLQATESKSVFFGKASAQLAIAEVPVSQKVDERWLLAQRMKKVLFWSQGVKKVIKDRNFHRGISTGSKRRFQCR